MEKKEQREKGSLSQPLFTGNYLRDSSISEYEKTADAARTVSGAIGKKLSKRKSDSQKTSDKKLP